MHTVDTLMARTRRFIETSRLSTTARAVRHERLTYLSPRKLRRLENALGQVLRLNIAGDIAEFGIALGGSGIILAEQSVRHGRHFHGFDVFGMIPPPASEKDDQKSKARYQKIVAGESSGLGGDVYYGYRDNLYEDVKRSFERYGLAVNGSSVSLHKGLFEETLPRVRMDRICFAHIDCDWYDPVHYCLKKVAERLSPGGVIVIDDYHDYGGSRTATDEFLQARPDFRFEDGENVILRRHAANA